MAETEVASPPQPPVEEIAGKGRPDRPRREPEDVPDMSVEEAHKALNALPKVRGGVESARNLVREMKQDSIMHACAMLMGHRLVSGVTVNLHTIKAERQRFHTRWYLRNERR